ncbi:MAG: LysR family transcriptional regulator [Bacteroidetes bacterium]|jgi:LysR family hydrogen peroxide-inducible transcriptional activator|nr:LysR family transcriptional regulator [Bacteroidota bacterium]
MTLTQLEYIIAVDNHRSFAKAARACHVTQPTLSMQVKKLVEDMGVLVFDRSKKPILTTDIGRRIVTQARTILRESSRIYELIKDEQDTVKGELRVGVIPTLGPYLLPQFLPDFMVKYPDVQLNIQELLSEEIIEKLKADQLDIGLLVTPLNIDGFTELPLFYETFVVYMSTSHPLSDRHKIDFDDLNMEDMWLLQEGHCFRSQAVNICGEGQQETQRGLRFESGSLETLRRIVEKQYGYTLLPELATMELSEELYNRHVRTFRNPQPVREVSIVLRRSFMKRRLVDILQKSILEAVPDILKNSERGKVVEWRG